MRAASVAGSGPSGAHQKPQTTPQQVDDAAEPSSADSAEDRIADSDSCARREGDASVRVAGSGSSVGTADPGHAYDGREHTNHERQHHGMAEFIYSMRKVRKAHGDKVILDDVSLNFLPGAKIGVVGPNGAGKSSVLRIMAGLDVANNGDALLQPGATVGILQQEPQLDETKTVARTSKTAWRSKPNSTGRTRSPS